MTTKEAHPTKIRFPGRMPPFSLDNPIQALYLKKKGVERLLARESGSGLGVEFAKETKKKIEMQSMLIDRRRGGSDAWKDHDDGDGESMPTTLETIPSFDDDDYEEKENNACPELSCCTADSADWSLPGVEEMSTDIRYVYGDGDYYDSERRQRQFALIKEKQQEPSDPVNAMEFLTKQLVCHPEMSFKIHDWIRCF